MSNKNKILVCCLTLLLVLSVGYALFSETITINGTATAKGSFEITTSCTPGISSFLTVPQDYMPPIQLDNSYTDDSCDVVNGVATFDASLLMPTAARNYTIKMTNTGTIDAQLWLLKNGEAVREDDSYGSIKVLKTSSKEVIADSLGIDGVIGEQIIAYEYANGNIIYEGDANQIDFFYFNSDPFDMAVILEPGESVYMIAYVNWPDERFEDYLNNGTDRHIEIDYSTVYNWIQAE